MASLLRAPLDRTTRVVLAYFVGLLAGGLVHFLIVHVIFGGYGDPNRSADDFFALELILIIPISLCLGSCMIGILSRSFIQLKRRKYLVFSPGLFLSGLLLAFLVAAGWFTQSYKDSLFWLMICVWWTLMSSLGIFVGFKIQEKRQYKPPSLDL